jgi:glutaconate CoA-transferase subunit A
MSKVCSLAEAVSSISSGSHVALPGFAITRCAMAFAHEVARQGIRDLTVSQCVGAMDADFLVGAGAVRKIIYGGGSLDRFGRLGNVNRGIENHTIEADEYSSLSVAFRYLAGSLGLPFIPIRSLNGSDLLNQLREKESGDIASLDDPFTGKNWLVLKPLVPDVAVVQVQACDAEGNAWIMGPRWDNTEQVKAAKKTIVLTEKLVPTEVIRAHPESIVIPGLFVSHVVEQPYSCYPTAVYREYDYDPEHIEKYVEAYSSPETFKQYIQDYVLSTKDHWEFLEKIGGVKKLLQLNADPTLGY